MISSTPNLLEFDPREIDWQFELTKHVRRIADYSIGAHEYLLSGSVGSGKSLPSAHIGVTHCLLYPGANLGVGRRALPQLKATALKKIREHLFNTGVEYRYNQTSGDFDLVNGSKITALSWADGNYSKFGSYELSAALVEEAQESKEETAYQFIQSRIGRLPHVREAFLMALANPDSPSHWLAKRFKLSERKAGEMIHHASETRHVYFSRTEMNKFLPTQYIEGLKTNMDPKLARRLIYGEWVEIDTERVYHAYDSERNFKRNESYKVDPRFPVRMSFDFNIARGKPLSVVFFQFINDTFHFFNEVVVEGIRTEQSLEEAAAKGLLDHKAQYIVHGDAAGKHNDTRSNRSDYDIIKHYLEHFKNKAGMRLAHSQDVPLSNPPVRKRHNLVNAYCKNELGKVRLFIYREAPTADEGLRLTQLKDNAQYIEDDSKPYQHISTAIGYGVNSCINGANRAAPSMMRRM